MDYSQLIHDIAKGHADILRSGIEAGERSAKPEIERLRTVNAELLEACNDVIQHWGAGLKHLDVGENNRLLVKMCEAANKAEGR